MIAPRFDLFDLVLVILWHVQNRPRFLELYNLQFVIPIETKTQSIQHQRLRITKKRYKTHNITLGVCDL